MRDKSYDEFMIEYFRKHPAFAASLVNDILEDGNDQGELKYVFQHIAGAGLRVSLVPATAKAKPRARARAGDVIRDVFIPDDRTEPRTRARAGAAKTAAKRAKQAPAAKRAPAAKPTKRAAPAAKRTKTAPSALPAGTGAEPEPRANGGGGSVA